MTLYQFIGICLAFFVNWLGFRHFTDYFEEEPPRPFRQEPQPEPITYTPPASPEREAIKQLARSFPLELTPHSLQPNPTRQNGATSPFLEDSI